MTAETRRLAAIVSTDVAGYSRLMGRDESGTLAMLRGLRQEVVDPVIAAHGGRIVKIAPAPLGDPRVRQRDTALLAQYLDRAGQAVAVSGFLSLDPGIDKLPHVSSISYARAPYAPCAMMLLPQR